MALITLDEARSYLRVDSHDEDALIGVLLDTAGQLSADVARLNSQQWKAVAGAEDADFSLYTQSELESIRSVMKGAVFYALAYLYEHREEADHHALTLTLRSILFAVREEVL